MTPLAKRHVNPSLITYSNAGGFPRLRVVAALKPAQAVEALPITFRCFPRLRVVAALKLVPVASSLDREHWFSTTSCRGRIEASSPYVRRIVYPMFSTTSCRGRIEAWLSGDLPDAVFAFSTTSCRGRIEARKAGQLGNRHFGFSTTSCRGRIEASAPSMKILIRLAVFHDFVSWPH